MTKVRGESFFLGAQYYQRFFLMDFLNFFDNLEFRGKISGQKSWPDITEVQIERLGIKNSLLTYLEPRMCMHHNWGVFGHNHKYSDFQHNLADHKPLENEKLIKGQLISKGLFGTLDSSKNRTKTTRPDVS